MFPLQARVWSIGWVEVQLWIYSRFFKIKFSEERKIRSSQLFSVLLSFLFLKIFPSALSYPANSSTFLFNVRLKILKWAVSSVPWIKSFNLINVMCIGSCYFNSVELKTLITYFIIKCMILSTILSKRQEHVICVLPVRIQNNLLINIQSKNNCLSFSYLQLISNPSSMSWISYGCIQKQNWKTGVRMCRTDSHNYSLPAKIIQFN